MMRSDEIETIQSIKDKTRYYIEQCSPESNIRYTDYFNHTFIPDMVIDWNKQERYLYIRTTSDINWITYAKNKGTTPANKLVHSVPIKYFLFLNIYRHILIHPLLALIVYTYHIPLSFFFNN